MSFDFHCYYPGEEEHFFVLELNLNHTVYHLQRKVREILLSDYKLRVTRKDLRLFKANLPTEPVTDLPSRALQWVQRQIMDDDLQDPTVLSSVFPDGPSSGVIHIMVADPEVWQRIEGLGDPLYFRHKKLRKDLGERLDALRPSSSPSDIIVHPPKILELLQGVRAHIHLGRPGEAPVAIFNPALATLQRRLDNLDRVQVDRIDVKYATDYLKQAIKFHANEQAREEAIKETGGVAVGWDGDWGTQLNWADGIKPACCWWHEEFLTMILELKNILGLGGNPVLQAIIDYSKIVSQEKYKVFREFCNFPTVLIGIAETRIDISIAVCVGEIHVTKLLTLDTTFGFLASDNIVRLARVFSALSSCRDDLKRYYDDVREKKVPKFSCLFPNPTPVFPSDVLPDLTYKQFLSRTGEPASVLVDLGNTTTAMYIATLNGTDKEVVVKFTARYNEKAHRILADAGFAPTLHFCGRVVGGMCMVVMDRVEGKSLWQLQRDNAGIPPVVLEHVRQAIRLLHEENIVFGDLRVPNVLYDASKGRAVLIDFDWPGVDEVDRYPATLNKSHDRLAEDVVPYGIMRKAHDLWQIQRLERLLQCSTT